MKTQLQRAQDALRAGKIVLLYDADGREEETDMVVASQHATADVVRTLRTGAGGLVCTTLDGADHQRLDLPYLSDMIQAAAEAAPVLKGLLPDDIQYDDSKPAFGLTINHRNTFTGITDHDRATTITELATFLAESAGGPAFQTQTRFGQEFRAPGHVTLLNAAPRSLHARQGHTELSTELLRMAGLTPSATICEMLDPATGKALSQKDARAYAEQNGLVFLTGQEVLDAWHNIPQSPALINA